MIDLLDVHKSFGANHVLRGISARIDKGEVVSYLVVSPSFPAFTGGHWEAINLPHAIFALPVRNEAPAPKRNLWNRLFTDKPEAAAVKAARRHVEALRPLILSTGSELEVFLGALNGGTPDLKKARAAAARMTSLATKADQRFRTP